MVVGNPLTAKSCRSNFVPFTLYGGDYESHLSAFVGWKEILTGHLDSTNLTDVYIFLLFVKFLFD